MNTKLKVIDNILDLQGKRLDLCYEYDGYIVFSTDDGSICLGYIEEYPYDDGMPSSPEFRLYSYGELMSSLYGENSLFVSDYLSKLREHLSKKNMFDLDEYENKIAANREESKIRKEKLDKLKKKDDVRMAYKYLKNSGFNVPLNELSEEDFEDWLETI